MHRPMHGPACPSSQTPIRLQLKMPYSATHHTAAQISKVIYFLNIVHIESKLSQNWELLRIPGKDAKHKWETSYIGIFLTLGHNQLLWLDRLTPCYLQLLFCMITDKPNAMIIFSWIWLGIKDPENMWNVCYSTVYKRLIPNLLYFI